MFSGEGPEQFAQDPFSSKSTGGHLLSSCLEGQIFWEGQKNLAHLPLISRRYYCEASNKYGVCLILLRKFSRLHFLFEPSRLLISKKLTTNTVFYVINTKKSQPHALLEPPDLFDLKIFSHLHVIRTLCLLVTSV